MNFIMAIMQRLYLQPVLMLFAIAMFLFGFSSIAIAKSVGCDDSYVQLSGNGLIINVEATGTDDTVNMQCALDVAASNNIRKVKLAAKTFYISNLIVNRFNGILEGRGKNSTTIEVIESSINCAAMTHAGMNTAVIKFIEGAPTVRYLSIKVGRPCANSQTIVGILHFTGKPALTQDCSSDVIFGAVDRVSIEGNSDPYSMSYAAVLVAAEAMSIRGCKNTLLGTFKLNRSELIGGRVGIMLSMRAGAQVDINYSEFSQNEIGIRLLDSNQNTTISKNTFNSEENRYFEYIGIYNGSYFSDSPTKSRLVVNENIFNISQPTGVTSERAYGVLAGEISDYVKKALSFSVVITDNTFNLNGDLVSGISARGVPNAHISGNLFIGVARYAIAIKRGGNYASGLYVSGATIVGNLGLSSFQALFGSNIHLGEYVSESIVGSGQNAVVDDHGVNNYVLD